MHDFLKRAKNEMRSLQACCMTDMSLHRRVYKGVAGLSMAYFTAVNMGVVAFADGGGIGDLGTRITNIVTEIYSATFAVVTVLAALLIVIALVVRMTANQQKATQATSWLTRIIICYALINCIGIIFSVIDSTTEGMGFTPAGGS